MEFAFKTFHFISIFNVCATYMYALEKITISVIKFINNMSHTSENFTIVVLAWYYSTV